MRLALDPFTGRATCRTCGLPIIWAVADNGRRMPIDSEATADGQWILWWLDEGNVITDRSGAVVSSALINVTARRTFNERYYQCPIGVGHASHLATCPGRVKPPEDPGIGARQLRLFNGGRR